MSKELETKLVELRASMEMGTSNIMPLSWKLLDECINLAAAQQPPAGQVTEELDAKPLEWYFSRQLSASGEWYVPADFPTQAAIDKMLHSIGKAWPYLAEHASHIDGEFNNAATDLRRSIGKLMRIRDAAARSLSYPRTNEQRQDPNTGSRWTVHDQT